MIYRRERCEMVCKRRTRDSICVLQSCLCLRLQNLADSLKNEVWQT